MELLKKDTSKVEEYIGIVFAVATAIYTGFLIGVIGSVPFWNTTILPILFVVSALSTGIAGMMLVVAFNDRTVVQQVISVKEIHLTLLVAEVFLIFTMLMITSSTNGAAAESVASLITGEYSLLFWLGLIVVGLMIPIVIEALELFNHKTLSKSSKGLEVAAAGNPGIAATVVTETAVLAGGFILRYLLLAAAVPVAFL